jgi:hypothetical protein
VRLTVLLVLLLGLPFVFLRSAEGQTQAQGSAQSKGSSSPAPGEPPAKAAPTEQDLENVPQTFFFRRGVKRSSWT